MNTQASSPCSRPFSPFLTQCERRLLLSQSVVPSDFPSWSFGARLCGPWATKLETVSLRGLAGAMADMHRHIFSSGRNPRAGGLGTGVMWCSEDNCSHCSAHDRMAQNKKTWCHSSKVEEHRGLFGLVFSRLEGSGVGVFLWSHELPTKESLYGFLGVFFTSTNK